MESGISIPLHYKLEMIKMENCKDIALNKDYILQLEEGREINKLISDLIIKPKYVKEKFYAVDGEDEGYYIGFDSQEDADDWVEKIKKETYLYIHPYLKNKGYIKKEYLYPNYSDDVGKALEIEEKIEKIGLKAVYIKSLKNVVGFSNTEDDCWKLIHASALDRCKAALIAIEKNTISESTNKELDKIKKWEIKMDKYRLENSLEQQQKDLKNAGFQFIEEPIDRNNIKD